MRRAVLVPLLLCAGLAQAQASAVKIVDPTDQTKQAGVTNSGGVRALNVYCVGGTCSGGGPSGGGWVPDGGYIGTVGQGPSRDGGVQWPVDTELPDPAALTDATANPTVPSAGSLLLGYNGATWDRLRSTTANGLLVDVSRIVTSLPAGTAYIGRVRQTDGTLDLSLLNSAPGSDTGQVSVPVRIISSLAGGAGGTSSSFGAAFPATGTAAGWSDGTNMQGARVFDADTGGGTQYVPGASIRVSASGGSAEAAAGAGTTSASTLRVVLPTDQTAIPVNDNGGSITVDGTVAVSNSFLLDATFTGRLPAGAALSDNFSNPTTTQVGAMHMLWDGVTWDRAPGNSTDGMLVNLGANNDVTVTGTVTANAGTGNFSENLAQVNGNTVNVGLGAAGTGTQRVILASDQTSVPVTDNGGSLTVDGTVAVSSVGGTVTVSGTVDTELPAAAALADTTANPTTTSVGALGLMYNGTTWDRVRGDTTNGVLVNVSDSFLLDATFTGRFSAAAAAADNFANPTTTGTLAFNMVWDGATWDRLPGTSALGLTSNTAFINGVAPSMGNGVSGTGVQRVTIASDSTGTLAVTQATAANLRTQTSAEGATGSAVPANASQAGFSDGTNLRAARVFDTDTGGGTQYTLGASIVAASSGGGVQVTSASTDNGSTGLAVYPISKFVTTGPTVTAVTCATTATAAPASTLTGRVTVTLYNNSSSTIYVGPSTVTTSNGLPLLPGASFTDNVEDTPYYCRVASGTAELRVLEN